jgi:putative addiction module component (TIGR02574 family)
MHTAELITLPLVERLQAMEALWDSLCRDQAQFQVVPIWHEDELSKRVAALDRGEERTTPWEVAKERIRQRAQEWANVPQ